MIDVIYVKSKYPTEISESIITAFEDPEKTLEVLKEYEDTKIDEVVRKVMYPSDKKGTIFINKISEDVKNIAVTRLLNVLLRQSNGNVLVSNDYAIFKIDSIDVLDSFISIPQFSGGAIKFTIDCMMSKNDKHPADINMYNLLAFLSMALNNLVDEQDFLKQSKDTICKSVNLAELSKVIDNVETAILLASTHFTYIAFYTAINEMLNIKINSVNVPTQTPPAEA